MICVLQSEIFDEATYGGAEDGFQAADDLKVQLLVVLSLEQVLAAANQPVEEQQTIKMIQLMLYGACLEALHVKG